MPLVRMKAAPVKADGERLGNEFMNGVFFSAHIRNYGDVLPLSLLGSSRCGRVWALLGYGL